MAQPNLKVYSSDGSTLLTSITTTATIGVDGSATAFRYVNDDSDGAVDTALNPSLTVRQIDPANGQAVLKGLVGVDERYCEIRALGTGSAGDSHKVIGWMRVGKGRSVFPGALASGGYHDMEIRYSPPASADEGELDFVFAGDDNSTALAIELGHTEASRDGIFSGIGDGNFTELVAFGTMTASGSPDNKVLLPDAKWMRLGIPYVKLSHQETLSNADSAAATLGASEAYWCRFTLGAGVVNQNKSVKFASGSPDPDDIPVTPDGEINLGYCLRTDAAAIGSSDITNEAIEERFAPSNLSGVILTIGPGRGRFDNSLIRQDSRSTVSLPPSTPDVCIWKIGNTQEYQLESDGRSDPRAYLLYKVDVGASSITMGSLVDYRDTIGGEEMPVSFFWAGVPAANAKAYGVHRSSRTGYLKLDRAFILAAATLGSGNSAGKLRVDFKVNGTTVFTSGIGASSKAPGLDWNSPSTVNTTGLAEVLVIPPFATFEAKITYAVAFDGTGPDNLSLTARIEVP